VPCGLLFFFSDRFELSWVIPSRVVNLFACGRLLVALRVLLCERWCLWREINDKSF
jgi:hypothetical protein